MIFPSCRHCAACLIVRRLCLAKAAYSSLIAFFLVTFFFAAFFRAFFRAFFFELRFFAVFFLAVFFFAGFLASAFVGSGFDRRFRHSSRVNDSTSLILEHTGIFLAVRDEWPPPAFQYLHVRPFPGSQDSIQVSLFLGGDQFQCMRQVLPCKGQHPLVTRTCFHNECKGPNLPNAGRYGLAFRRFTQIGGVT